ncbi:hypothetical protein [European catfish virus]|uniref:Uncharacterized protein n=1 Tax=European catfish virus TaxID=84739 RepID=I2BFL0_9VIRU|nr:hypothetical protein A190_gp030 [European catfish virus]AFJ52313.1 hypothetical protein [European catfish virus]AMZ04859.1 hypothetical protein [European catfish virus]AMZ04995.1 hypothetical protein [European catfish virus]
MLLHLILVLKVSYDKVSYDKVNYSGRVKYLKMLYHIFTLLKVLERVKYLKMLHLILVLESF